MSTSDKTALTAADLAAASYSCPDQLALWCWLVSSHTSGQLKIGLHWINFQSICLCFPFAQCLNMKHCSKLLHTNVDCGFWESELLLWGRERQWSSGEMFHIGHQMKTLPINSSSRDQVHIIEINLKAWSLWESKCVMAGFQNITKTAHPFISWTITSQVASLRALIFYAAE